MIQRLEETTNFELQKYPELIQLGKKVHTELKEHGYYLLKHQIVKTIYQKSEEICSQVVTNQNRDKYLNLSAYFRKMVWHSDDAFTFVFDFLDYYGRCEYSI